MQEHMSVQRTCAKHASVKIRNDGKQLARNIFLLYNINHLSIFSRPIYMFVLVRLCFTDGTPRT